MQDQDAPPVEEGETGGGAGVVRAAQTQADIADAINSTAASTPHPWTIAIAQRWRAEIMVRDRAASGQDSLPTIPRLNQSRSRRGKMPIHASLALWMICSSRPRSRKPPASLTSKLSL